MENFPSLNNNKLIRKRNSIKEKIINFFKNQLKLLEEGKRNLSGTRKMKEENKRMRKFFVILSSIFFFKKKKKFVLAVHVRIIFIKNPVFLKT